MAVKQTSCAIRFADGTAILCLESDLDGLQRVRQALREQGFSGNHFAGPRHNGRTYRHGLYLNANDRTPATRADRRRLLDLVRQILAQSGSPITNPAAPIAAADAASQTASSVRIVAETAGASSYNVAQAHPTADTPAVATAPPPSDWHAALAAWRRDVARVFSTYPTPRDGQ